MQGYPINSTLPRFWSDALIKIKDDVDMDEPKITLDAWKHIKYKRIEYRYKDDKPVGIQFRDIRHEESPVENLALKNSSARLQSKFKQIDKERKLFQKQQAY